MANQKIMSGTCGPYTVVKPHYCIWSDVIKESHDAASGSNMWKSPQAAQRALDDLVSRIDNLEATIGRRKAAQVHEDDPSSVSIRAAMIEKEERELAAFREAKWTVRALEVRVE